jgi:exopolyphosphatase/guanosine-5'-triphosphate,3'-diphosphate pyrophosphatase
MVAHVRAQLEQLDPAQRFGPLFKAGRGQLIGNSGTVTSLAGVHLRLDRYLRSAVDGIWMSREGAEEARRRLHDATREERAKEPCIGPERADLVLAGCAILDAVWSLWPSHRLRVGDRGLREGILLSMIHGAPQGARRRRKRRGASSESKTPEAAST